MVLCFARMELRYYDSTALTDHVNRFSVTPCVIINPGPSRINIRIDQDSRDKKVHVTSYEVHSYQVVLGAFHLGKKPGNFGGGKSGISDW